MRSYVAPVGIVIYFSNTAGDIVDTFPSACALGPIIPPPSAHLRAVSDGASVSLMLILPLKRAVILSAAKDPKNA